MNLNEINNHLPNIIGDGYKDFWHCKSRYRVVKGSRGSKKSTTTALWLICNMMKPKYKDANTLVVRRFFNIHKDSTYTQLKWAIKKLNVECLWQCKLSPLEIIFLKTGQKILFRGLDDPMSITSITVDTGFLCWCWIEEAYQITKEDDFNKLDLSIRGEMPPGLFKQFTLTFNPWNEKHWIKKRFFDAEDSNILAMTTNYTCNEFLGEDDIEIFEKMKIQNPRRYQVEGLGNWGMSEGLIYTNWEEQEFDYKKISKLQSVKSAFGLDFGYTNDPTALICCLVDKENKNLYVFDEYYEKAMVNSDIAEIIKYKGYAKEKIIADSAEPKSIEEIKRLGINRIKEAKKGKDSILNGIQRLQGFKIIVHPKCQNTILEFSNYVWNTKDGQTINKPIDDYNHLMDALRYATEYIDNGDYSKIKGVDFSIWG